MARLGDLYTDFSRIDLDTPGGYARVAQVKTHGQAGYPEFCAFKLMRHEIVFQKGFQRFKNEMELLVAITGDKNAPVAITRIYDSGFAPVELSLSLHKLHDGEMLNPNLDIISTGIEIQKFLDMRSILNEGGSDNWLPYLVVELATYDDNLRRQIQPQSAGESLDLYKLPVDTIVEMAVQILDVMDYLHKKLRCAYTDWKPEHIYWNDAVRQVKLIDWNATIPLSGGLGDKQTIREDIRMFCGAVLYCSLALSDPEELTRPIGPPPTVPKDLIRLIPPRYWTDKPNFYERDYILDEEIKRLVQKGLDPKQGFNSPQELKIALIQYIERSSKQSIGYIGKSSDQDLFSKLPHNHDAVQYYRRARSYIATNDFSLAIISLEIAIAAAKAEGIEHPEAEQLLKSAQASEARQSAKQALESEKWKDALNLYARAVSLDPTNAMLRKEFDSLRGLLHAESKLRNKSIQRIFISPSQLQTNLIIVKGIVSANKPLLNYIEKQLHWIRLMRIRLVRIGGLGMLIALLLIIMSEGIKLNNIPYIITGTHPPTSTSTITSTITSTVTVTPTITVSPTITVTHTLEPTPTIVLGYGRLIAFFFALETPNGKRIEPGLRKNQQITIVDSRLDYGDLWYKCIWEEDGLLKEGWILGKYIEFGTRPITTATP